MRTDNRWNKQVLKKTPCLGQRNVGDPTARWCNELRHAAGTDWMRKDHDQAQWQPRKSLCLTVNGKGLKMRFID